MTPVPLIETGPIAHMLALIPSFTTLPPEFERLTEALGPAVTALTLFPETEVSLRLAEQGLVMPDVLFRLLQNRSPAVAERFQRIFPKVHYTWDEFCAAFLETDRTAAPSPLRDVVLATGLPGADPEILPFVLGGFFVFQKGGWGEVLLDDRLSVGSSPLPLHLMLLRRDPHKGPSLLAYPLPEGWGGAEDLLRRGMRQLGYRTHGQTALFSGDGLEGTFTLDPERRTLQSIIQQQTEGAVSNLEVRYHYDASDVRATERGITLFAPRVAVHPRVTHWEITSVREAKDDRLDPNVSQFFYLPGALIEALGYAGAVEDFQMASFMPILAIVNAARRHKNGWRPNWPSGVSLDPGASGSEDSVHLLSQGSPRTPPVPLRVSFNLVNEQGLPLLWRYERLNEPTPRVVDCLLITEGTVDRTQQYVTLKGMASHQSSRLFRGPSVAN